VLKPRMGKLVPPRRPWKDRANIAIIGPKMKMTNRM